MHILLITRHYPPEVSGGARRPYLYTQALRTLGHKVTLVTPFDLDDVNSISVRNAAIDKGLKAIKERKLLKSDQTLLTKFKNKFRIWAYWPDDNIIWVNDVIKAVIRQDIKPDWILTTNPPESIHIAGAKLSKHLGVPWIAEMRDTWVNAPHRKILETSKIRAGLEKYIAKKTLSAAKAITAVSEIVMSEARDYVKPNTPECIISHFSDPVPAPYNFDDSKINLVHTGGFTLSDRRRQLHPLLKLLDEAYVKRDNIVLHIAGPLSAEELNLIEAAQITVEWHGLVSLNQARALQAGSDALILCTPLNSHALPGKYAEYALANKPILYLGGGPWLKLAEDPDLLRPLSSAIFTIDKNEYVSAKKSLTHIQAAKNLIVFLEKIDG